MSFISELDALSNERIASKHRSTEKVSSRYQSFHFFNICRSTFPKSRVREVSFKFGIIVARYYPKRRSSFFRVYSGLVN